MYNFLDGIVSFFFICIGLAIALGMLLMWGAPRIWELVKPWLHVLTA